MQTTENVGHDPGVAALVAIPTAAARRASARLSGGTRVLVALIGSGRKWPCGFCGTQTWIQQTFGDSYRFTLWLGTCTHFHFLPVRFLAGFQIWAKLPCCQTLTVLAVYGFIFVNPLLLDGVVWLAGNRSS